MLFFVFRIFSKQCERTNIEKQLTLLGLKHVSQYFTNVIYLQDMGVEIAGVKFYGSPWLKIKILLFKTFMIFPRVSTSPTATFYSPRNEIMNKWNHIPCGIDVLITCQPPLGIQMYVEI